MYLSAKNNIYTTYKLFIMKYFQAKKGKVNHQAKKGKVIQTYIKEKELEFYIGIV